MSDQSSDLHQMQDELRALARELCDGISRPVRDDETGEIANHPVPPLLEQLRDSVGHSGGSSRSSGRTSLPLNPDAFDALRRIELDAAELHRHAMSQDSITVDARIRAIVAIAGRWTSPGMVAAAADHLRRFVKEIENVLNPPRRYEITAPCPACGVRTVWREQDGEQVRVPALTVDAAIGCTCLNCRHVWGPGQLEHLALVIGCDPINPDEAVA